MGRFSAEPCTKFIGPLERYLRRREEGDELPGLDWNFDDTSRTKGKSFGRAKSRAHSFKNFERLAIAASSGAAGGVLRAALRQCRRDQRADKQGYSKISDQFHG